MAQFVCHLRHALCKTLLNFSRFSGPIMLSQWVLKPFLLILIFQSIIDDTEGELNELLSLQEKSRSEFRETVKFFGEKETTATTEEFFGIFAAFIMNFEVSDHCVSFTIKIFDSSFSMMVTVLSVLR